MDREAWHAAVQGVTKSRTCLSDWTELMPILKIYKLHIEYRKNMCKSQKINYGGKRWLKDKFIDYTEKKVSFLLKTKQKILSSQFAIEESTAFNFEEKAFDKIQHAFMIKTLQKASTEGTSVQFSRVRLFVTPWTTAYQASLSITNSQSPPKPMSIESVMPSNHLILCHPLLLLPSISPSIRVFSNESALHIRWPKEHTST